MTRALVIGYGSIGQRHAHILQQFCSTVGVVTQQSGLALPSWTVLQDALDRLDPQYVVVANATWRHLPTVQALAEAAYDGTVIIEKPAASTDEPWPDLPFAHTYVAYNLRFHPLLQALRERLADDPPLSLSAYCGQHLSTWRPGRDWREGYSASASDGGGVLRDLSHELDYTLWLLGPWARVAALGGNLGVLGIDADEAWSILIESRAGTMGSVAINYLDRPARRSIIATTRRATYEVDFIAGVLRTNGTLQHFEVDRNDSYIAMHRAALENDERRLCSLAEGLAVNRLVAAVEEARKSRNWVAA